MQLDLQGYQKSTVIVWASVVLASLNPILLPICMIIVLSYTISFLASDVVALSATLALDYLREMAMMLMIGYVERVTTLIEYFAKKYDASTAWVLPDYYSYELKVRDGTRITYHVIPGKSYDVTVTGINETHHHHPQLNVMILAAGLGIHGYSGYAPIIHHYGDDYTYITWDYRGLFDSEQPENMQRMSIDEHVEDLNEILIAEGIQRAECIIGHSMGVQVALEFALVHPDKVQSLILLNGAHGKVFQSALQPLTYIPLMTSLINAIVGWQMQSPITIPSLSPYVRRVVKAVPRLLANNNLITMSEGAYLNVFLSEYLYNADERTVANYWRLFLELDNHSVHHRLSGIKQPTLLIGGGLDFLTPIDTMRVMKEKIPNSQLVVDWRSTHMTLLENTEV
eukprot:Ihof_evm3s246 gene=Ihof_evmTU3s246